MAGCITDQVIFPSEQVLCIGVEIEGVSGSVVLPLTRVLELHGEPCLAGAVVGIKKNEFYGLRRVI
ncbi:hypothetical protein D3C76_1289170 [compost metagenome]